MDITKGKIIKAKKVVVYGVEGIGKSTFAAQFPDVLFADTEGSTAELDVARFDKPVSWEMLKAQADYVKQAKPCRTFVIDTIDWAEQLCLESVCAAYGKKGIEDFGYGNGYTYEKEEFGRFLNSLQEIVDIGINVVITAHAIIRKFEQPDELGSYDRYELKLGNKTTNKISPLIKEWADMVLFANYKTLSVAVDDKGKKHKAQGGRRVMYTAHHPCWDAKNRFGLPDELPFDYAQIRHIIENVPAVPAIPAPVAQPAAPAIQQPIQTAPPVTPVTAPVDFTQPTQPTPPAEPTSPTQRATDIPPALAQLMQATHISEAQIRSACAGKGYFPADMPISAYPVDFVNGVLIGAWQQISEYIINKNYPF